MARHRFGEGQYRYFAPPLPDAGPRVPRRVLAAPSAESRASGPRGAVSPRRGPTISTNGSSSATRPGQTRPTPLILRYGAGDWNALHRDLYGDLVFPLQVVVGLDRPGDDFTGGEFVVVEQRPRAQSRATVDRDPAGPRARVHDPRPADPDAARLVGRADAPRRQHRALAAAATPSAWSSTTPPESARPTGSAGSAVSTNRPTNRRHGATGRHAARSDARYIQA